MFVVSVFILPTKTINSEMSLFVCPIIHTDIPVKMKKLHIVFYQQIIPFRHIIYFIHTEKTDLLSVNLSELMKSPIISELVEFSSVFIQNTLTPSLFVHKLFSKFILSHCIAWYSALYCTLVVISSKLLG